MAEAFVGDKDCLGQCDEILKEWSERKERISQGIEEPYDTNAWESKIRKLEQETAERKRRRARKRRRVAEQVYRLHYALIRRFVLIQ